ncbi:hypothetical protein HUU05_25480 [candidate division KSB1 bacterium]|nr:hypothetical protein [candidate division KSB1 bacterium]
MKTLARLLRGLMNAFLKFFGDVKVFRFPFFIVYDPGSYHVKGADTREVMRRVQPGDILIRGYKSYLDGYFIPGYFSHAGLYLGEVLPEHKELVPSPKGKKLFRSGEQIVAHAMAEGVFMEDLISFCRCDYMAVLRFPERFSRRDGAQDFSLADFIPEEHELVNALRRGEELLFTQTFPVVFKVALAQVGKSYDFQFNFTNYNNLSCTEYVYFCLKALEPYHGLGPAKKRFLIFNKTVLTPDAFAASVLLEAWKSPSVSSSRWERLRKR